MIDLNKLKKKNLMLQKKTKLSQLSDGDKIFVLTSMVRIYIIWIMLKLGFIKRMVMEIGLFSVLHMTQSKWVVVFRSKMIIWMGITS